MGDCNGTLCLKHWYIQTQFNAVRVHVDDIFSDRPYAYISKWTLNGDFTLN